MENKDPGEKVPLYKQCPDKLEAIFTFLDWTKKDLDVTKECGVDTWAYLSILVCDTSVRVPGLGTCLVKTGMDVLAETGIKVITTIATSHYSGKIFQKLGFKLLNEISYDEYKVDGVVVFPPSEPHTHVKLFLKT